MKIMIEVEIDDTDVEDKQVAKIVANIKNKLWTELATYYGSSDVGTVKAEVVA